MRDRLHGVLADVVVESFSLDGFYNSEEVMARIKEVAGDQVIALAPTMETPGILQFRYPGGQVITQPVQIIGVRPEDRAKTGDFAEFLFDDQNQKIAPSFEVTDRAQDADRRPARSSRSLRRQTTDGQADERAARSSRCDEQAPDDGTILGYALATFHRGKDQPTSSWPRPAPRSACSFPGPASQGRRGASTRSRSSATSRAG